MRGLNVLLCLGLALGHNHDELPAPTPDLGDLDDHLNDLEDAVNGLFDQLPGNIEPSVCQPLLTEEACGGNDECEWSNGSCSYKNQMDIAGCIAMPFIMNCQQLTSQDEMCNCMEGLDTSSCDQAELGKVQENIRTCKEGPEETHTHTHTHPHAAPAPTPDAPTTEQPPAPATTEQTPAPETTPAGVTVMLSAGDEKWTVPECIAMAFVTECWETVDPEKHCECAEGLDRKKCNEGCLELIKVAGDICKDTANPPTFTVIRETKEDPLKTGTETESSGLSGGAVAGIVIGLLIGVPALCYGGYMLWNKYND